MATVLCIVDVVFEEHLQKHKRKLLSFYLIDETMTGMEEEVYINAGVQRVTPDIFFT
jgi:hypothetical protein